MCPPNVPKKFFFLHVFVRTCYNCVFTYLLCSHVAIVWFDTLTQGLEALKEHFKNSRFPCGSDEYLPVSFSPPRDGRQQTEPVPIVSRSPATAAGESSSPPKSCRPSVDPLAQQLMPGPPSSSGDVDDGASSTTASTHAPSDDDHADEEDEDNEEEEDRLLAGELRRLGYTD